MRIGFFTDTFFPQTNGVVNAITAFGEDLVARGHDVFVFAPGDRLRKTKRLMLGGMQVFSVPSIPFRPYPGYRVAIPVVNVPQLDIVHTHGPFSMGLFGLHEAKKQNIPAVSTLHTLVQEFVNYAAPLGKRFLRKVAEEYCSYHYSKYDAIITPTSVIKNGLSENLRRKTFVVNNGVDTNFFRPCAKQRSRRLTGVTCEGRVFLYLGRLSAEKNVDLLIEAAPEFLNANDRLVIVGAGPMMSGLKQQARKSTCATRIRFLGFAPQKLLPYHYSAADAFITASTAETSCLAALESMACGTPVIAANARALPETVKNGRNGFLFRAGNARDLARVARDFMPSRHLSEGALKTARQNSRENAVKRLEKVYEKVLSSTANAKSPQLSGLGAC